jgi:hypothetical protein
MEEQVILVLQGGGALGAFECGVWRELAPALRKSGRRLAALAGASIGAINAAFILRHADEPDWGAKALEAFWRQQLARPAIPFLPPGNSYRESWNGLLSTVLAGHLRMFWPNPAGWLPMTEGLRFFLPPYQTAPMERLLQTHIGTLGPTGPEQPLLLVRAIDIEQLQPRLFNSREQAITAQQLVASASQPMLFPPRLIDGHWHWDGSFWPHTMARDVLNALQAGPPGSAPARYLLVLVDACDSLSEDLPVSSLHMGYRLYCQLFSPRADYDEAAIATENRYLQLVQELSAGIGDADTPLAARVRREAERVRRENRSLVRCVHIRRAALPYEHVSRDADYSPRRLDALIEQGAQTAQAIRASLDAGVAAPA